MRKIIFLLLLTSGLGFSQTILLDFESSTTWTDFDGGVLTTIVNPHNNSDNNSANVGQMVKNAGQPWGGSWTQLGSAIDFTNNNTLSLKVFSSRVGAKVLLKVENATDANINFQKEVITTVANGWETLTFDFSAINKSNSYEKVVLIFDNGTMGDGSSNFTFYLDELILSNTINSGPAISLPIDFENAITWTDFDGGSVTSITNPQRNSNNNSLTVGQMIKSAGKTWGGSYLLLSSSMDFASNDTFTMKVFSPRIGAKVLLKVENSGDANITYEKESLTTIANGWETLTFNFASINQSNSYDKLVVIFDNGTMGDGSANFTFYFDDIALSKTGGGGDQIDLPVTFEEAKVEYGVIGFGDAISTIVSNPHKTGDNVSDNVVKVVKQKVSPTWAGTTITAASEKGLKTPIPFSSTDTKMTVVVWSPDSGIQVRLKAEDHEDNTHTVETEATTTIANGWEVLEFNFSNQAAGTETLSHGLNNGWKYDKVSIFFNFGVDGVTAGEKTYYFDNLAFGDRASLSIAEERLFKFTTYPNPTKNKIFFSAKDVIRYVTIYNVLGKKVKHIQVNNKQAEVNLSDLSKGIYILNYRINEFIGTKKFIKD